MNQLLFMVVLVMGVLVMGVLLATKVKGNDTCTICNCVTCPLSLEDCKEILEVVSNVFDPKKQKTHLQKLHGIYLQENAKCRVKAEKLQKKLIQKNPELEELD